MIDLISTLTYIVFMYASREIEAIKENLRKWIQIRMN